MAEVIDLLSSSPPQVPISTKRPEARSNASISRDILADFDFDNFDATGDLSFRIEQPAKRRRLSPGRNEASKPTRSSRLSVALDLSSEPDVPGLPILPSINKGKKPRIPSLTADIDDIVFSSSAPGPRKQKRNVEQVDSEQVDAVFDLSSDSLPDDPLQISPDRIFFSSQPATENRKRTGFSSRSDTNLADLTGSSQIHTNGKLLSTRETIVTKSSATRIKTAGGSIPDTLIFDDIFVSSPPKRNERKAKRNPEDDNNNGLATVKVAERASLKAKKKAEKDAERDAEKDRKRREKEETAREKQIAADKAEVNKSKLNKNDTTSEMIVEISASLQDTSVGNQVAEYMKELSVDTHFVDEEVNLTSDGDQFHDVRSIVRWKRKVASVYDDENDEWVRIARQRIAYEKHILIYLTALDFIKLMAGHATGGEELSTINEDVMRQNVDLYVTKARYTYANCVPILLIQGLDAWLKKNANAKNREYTATVRAKATIEEDGSNPQVTSSSQSGARKRKKPAMPAVDLSFVTLDAVNELMLHLQLNHQPIVIQRTTSPATSASEIMKFTQHLSTRPGRIAFQEFNLKSASFCMESGQVKTGDNTQETYVKMLQEVQRITPSMAYGIAAEYGSVLKLIQGFRRSNNLMLEDIRKSTNKDGGWSDKRLGPMVSRRLYKIFTGRDPAATDGMS